jgi:hypothetical protein
MENEKKQALIKKPNEFIIGLLYIAAALQMQRSGGKRFKYENIYSIIKFLVFLFPSIIIE